MPAIQITRLRIQAAKLCEYFSRPSEFVAGLHALLDFYADRTHRPGRSGLPAPLMKAYNAPAPVLRQLLLELMPLAAADPAGALALGDELWRHENLECRTIAANLLGMVDINPPEPILQRAKAWAESENEDHLLEVLFREGMKHIRQESPDLYINLLRGWLDSPHILEKRTGLRAARILADDPSFENLPVLFRLLTPFSRTALWRLRPYIVHAFSALARRSPKETAFFLKQNLNTPECPDTTWLIRQVLDDFPPEIQAGLRVAIRRS